MDILDRSDISVEHPRRMSYISRDGYPYTSGGHQCGVSQIGIDIPDGSGISDEHRRWTSQIDMPDGYLRWISQRNSWNAMFQRGIPDGYR